MIFKIFVGFVLLHACVCLSKVLVTPQRQLWPLAAIQRTVLVWALHYVFASWHVAMRVRGCEMKKRVYLVCNRNARHIRRR